MAKFKWYGVIILIMAVLTWSLPVNAEKKKTPQLELFGVVIKGASREQLRQVFKQNGMNATREDAGYWADIYDASGVLEGASEFQAGYVAATNQFAYAQYTFHGFMNTQLVGKVINMVSIKYGKPSSQSGSYGLGEVSAKWNMGQGMQIEVSRGWPDTTTYLMYKDTSSYNQMRSEIEAEKKSQEQQKARSQSNAF